jgi:phosphatidylethanolamine-binding protein (PEBP) family uncharacterized protein
MIRAVAIVGVVLATASGVMQLQSSDFSAGGKLPRAVMAAQCGGQNRSPALAWADAPKTAKSFALVVHDADAPIPGGFYHWVVYNLPAGMQRLAANAKLSANQPRILWSLSTAGPGPPLHVHALRARRGSDRTRYAADRSATRRPA